MCDADQQMPTPSGRLPRDIWSNVARFVDFDDLIEMSATNSHMVSIVAFEVEERAKETWRANKRLQVLLRDLTMSATLFYDRIVPWLFRQAGNPHYLATRVAPYWDSRSHPTLPNDKSDQALRESLAEIKELCDSVIQMCRVRIPDSDLGRSTLAYRLTKRLRFMQRVGVPSWDSDCRHHERIMLCFEFVEPFTRMPMPDVHDPLDFDKATDLFFTEYLKELHGEVSMQRKWKMEDGQLRLAGAFVEWVASNIYYQVLDGIEHYVDECLDRNLPNQNTSIIVGYEERWGQDWIMTVLKTSEKR